MNQPQQSTSGVAPDTSPVRVSTFPAPPWQYICKFTNDAVKANRTPKPPVSPYATASSPTVFSCSTSQLPENPVLANSGYFAFGKLYLPDDHVMRSLESQNFVRLDAKPQPPSASSSISSSNSSPSSADNRKELRKLNVAMLANYLDLLEFTNKNSSAKCHAQLLRLEQIFVNMHHLVNEYRAFQARDTLREISSHQIDLCRETTDLALRYQMRAAQLHAEMATQIASPTAELQELEDLKQKFGEILTNNQNDNNNWLGENDATERRFLHELEQQIEIGAQEIREISDPAAAQQQTTNKFSQN